MLTVKGTAERLGVSSALVFSLCAAGKIRHERHSLGRGTICIPEDALDDYRRSASRPEQQKSEVSQCPSS